MSTVSPGGAPVVSGGAPAAIVARPPAAADGGFEALLPPIVAELVKGGVRTIQPETLAASDEPVADPAKPATQPAVGAAAQPPRTGSDGAEPQPLAITLSVPQPEAAVDPPVGNVAASSKPALQDLGTLRPQKTVRSDTGTTPEAAAGTVTAAPALSIDTLREPVELPARPVGVSEAAGPVTNEARPQDGTRLATAEPPVAVSTPVYAAALPHVAAAGVRRPTSTATAADGTDNNPAPARPEPTTANPVPSVAASVGSHGSARPQSSDATAAELTSEGTVAAAQAGPSVVALPQPAAVNPPPITQPAKVPDIVPTAAISPSTASVPTAVTSTGTIAAVTTDIHDGAAPLLDLTNQQLPEAASVWRTNSAAPVPAPAIHNAIAEVSASQSQPRDVLQPDLVATPLYSVPTTVHTTPSNTAIVPPDAPSAAPVTEQIAVHVAQTLNEGARTVTVELHPAELGRVEIHLSFHSDGMNVRMTVDRPETFDALSHDRSGLEQQLAQAGVDLGSGGLDLRLGQPQSGQPEDYSNARTFRTASTAPQPQSTPETLWVSNSLLDILA